MSLVPNLDWPSDLFQDICPVPDEPTRVFLGAGLAEPGMPLWPAVQGLWMRDARGSLPGESTASVAGR
ncbi:MAG: hypothetical protein J2P47_00510 [Acetobacteraceae bacterium]|nr:hypothetical protein [Acetobacteraceae bacterium]